MTKYFDEKDRVTLLIQAQRDYIALLEKALQEVMTIAFVHGYVPGKEDVDMGVMLREKIELLSKIERTPNGVRL